MRQIAKTLQIPIDGKPFTFRLRKMDALSGACLLRKLANQEESNEADLADLLFGSMTDEELRSLMVHSLEHVDVLLDAGFQPIMQMGEWSWSDLQYDPGNALLLTMKEIVWTLDGFFVENGSISPPARPVT